MLQGKELEIFVLVAVPILIGGTVFLLLFKSTNKFLYQLPKLSAAEIMSQNKTLSEKIDTLIIESGFSESLDATKIYQIIITLFILFSVSMFIRGNIVFGLIISSILSIAIPIGTLTYIKNRRQSQMELQLVDFFNEMSTRMQVSTSTLNAFTDSIPNTDFPLRPVLEKIAKNAQHLKSFELALDASRTAIASPYYQDFIDAIQIHREAGGDVRLLINMVVEQINVKMITLKKFKAAMAAINLQLLLIFIAPPIASWLNTMSNPDNAKVLFGSFGGFLILGGAVLCYVIGIGFSIWLKERVKKQIS